MTNEEIENELNEPNAAKQAEYRRLAHAVQAGVAHKMQYDPDETSPKHLRVGVNMAMVDFGALLQILINKGIITIDEFLDAALVKLEEEKASYEKQINDHYKAGGSIKLGSLY